jgi:hypothetical protein
MIGAAVVDGARASDNIFRGTTHLPLCGVINDYQRAT